MLGLVQDDEITYALRNSFWIAEFHHVTFMYISRKKGAVLCFHFNYQREKKEINLSCKKKNEI